MSLLLALFLLFSLCGCNRFSDINLKESIPISESGIIEKSILQQIKNENTIATFTGESNGYKYEWTVFGSDIDEAKAINLSLILNDGDEENSVKGSFVSNEKIEIPLVLSIHLKEKWTAQNAVVYKDGLPVCSAFLTGNQTSILNFSVTDTVGSFTIIAEKTPTPAESKTENETSQNQNTSSETREQEHYLSKPQNGTSGRVYSDGKATEQDKYKTDPIPEGKPMPVEPEDQKVDDKKTYTCTFSIECSTILNNLSDLEPDKFEVLPKDGIILKKQTVTFCEGESVYDVLQRICKENNIHMEASWTPMYNSAYVEGIHNLYEFDCGSLSGWMYRVNGWYPNYGCSRYQLAQGDIVEWRYTCDLGRDVGCDWLVDS